MISSKEIHELAIEKGWWSALHQRTIDEILALFHSEVSEALEEYRKGNIELYYEDEKPCGYWIELADLKIRLQDALEGWKSNQINFSSTEPKMGLLCEFHDLISTCHEQPSSFHDIAHMLINGINFTAEQHEINIDEMVKIKHEYNKTRPYRHGNKTC